MTWLEYFNDCLDKFDFHPVIFDCEDKNLSALASKEAFRAWYGQGPGKPRESYRDTRFYVRELTTISKLLQPKTIVELGTSLGIGALLLRILNPDAEIVSVDDKVICGAGDGKDYAIGHVGVMGGARDVRYCYSTSWMAPIKHEADLTFIDADHSYDAVKMDSNAAWDWKNPNHWAIAWHDYHPETAGTIRAVDEFCESHQLQLRRLEDSATVWCASEDVR